MYIISGEILDLVGGGTGSKHTGSSSGGASSRKGDSSPPGGNGGSGGSAGSARVNCPPGTLPVVASGNINASVGGVTLAGGGEFGTCIPYVPHVPDKKQDR